MVGSSNLSVPTTHILAPKKQQQSETDFDDFALWLKRAHHIMDSTIAVKIRKLKALQRARNGELERIVMRIIRMTISINDYIILTSL